MVFLSLYYFIFTSLILFCFVFFLGRGGGRQSALSLLLCFVVVFPLFSAGVSRSCIFVFHIHFQFFFFFLAGTNEYI